MAQLLAEEGVFDRGFRFRSMVLPDSFIQQDTPEAMYRVAAMSASGQYGPTRVAAAFVGYADLTLGARAEAVLTALMEAGGSPPA